MHSDDGAHVRGRIRLSAQLVDAAQRQRLREHISRISLCQNFHHIQPAFIPRCSQPEVSGVQVSRQPESLTLRCRPHHSLDVACDRHTCVACVVPEVSGSTLETEASNRVDTAAYQFTPPRRKRHRLLPSGPESRESSIVDKHPST